MTTPLDPHAIRRAIIDEAAIHPMPTIALPGIEHPTGIRMETTNGVLPFLRMAAEAEIDALAKTWPHIARRNPFDYHRPTAKYHWLTRAIATAADEDRFND